MPGTQESPPAISYRCQANHTLALNFMLSNPPCIVEAAYRRSYQSPTASCTLYTPAAAGNSIHTNATGHYAAPGNTREKT